jgi:hypothetical protein
MHSARLLLWLLTAACSVVPEASTPPQEEVLVLAVHEFGAQGPRPVRAPQSGADLTVLDLEASAELQESFAAGQRWLRPPAGTPLLTLRCRYRSYLRKDGSGPTPASLFPDATSVTRLQAAK